MEKNDYLDILKSTDLRPKKINVEDRRETIIMEQGNEMSIHDKIKDWFRKNPNPNDDQVHDLAKEWGISEEELERHIYMILSNLLQKTDTKINENKEHLLSEIFIEANEIESMAPGPRRNMQILRLSIIAEYDATNLYEKFAEMTDNMDIRKVM
jgi:vacuolar-type H+-ATPase catalytic subunit A/Vma1